MRFPQLKIGQQFEYQGKRYTKTGPLTATEEETGASAMIRRSAEVVVITVGKVTEAPVEPLKQNYNRQEVLDLFQASKINLASQLRVMASDEGGLQLEPVLKVIDNTLTLS
jgi:hypothetical protein